MYSGFLLNEYAQGLLTKKEKEKKIMTYTYTYTNLNNRASLLYYTTYIYTRMTKMPPTY